MRSCKALHLCISGQMGSHECGRFIHDFGEGAGFARDWPAASNSNCFLRATLSEHARAPGIIDRAGGAGTMGRRQALRGHPMARTPARSPRASAKPAAKSEPVAIADDGKTI